LVRAAASHSSHTGITACRAAGRLEMMLFGREQGGGDGGSLSQQGLQQPDCH